MEIDYETKKDKGKSYMKERGKEEKETSVNSSSDSCSRKEKKICKKTISKRVKRFMRIQKRKQRSRMMGQLLQRIYQRRNKRMFLMTFCKHYKVKESMNHHHHHDQIALSLSEYRSNKASTKQYRHKKISRNNNSKKEYHTTLQVILNDKDKNDAKEIVSSIIDSIITKAIEISSQNTIINKAKTYSPQYAIKGFSFTVNTPNNNHDDSNPMPHTHTHTPTIESSSTLSTSSSSSISGQRTKYPLTTTSFSSNTIYNHLILNINNTNHINHLPHNHNQLPFHMPMLKPSFYHQAFPNSNDYFPLEKFYQKLNEDLKQFTESIDFSNTLLHDIKGKCITIVKSIAMSAIDSYYQSNSTSDETNEPILNTNSISFELFGSFANGLSIDTSDIDILIKYSSATNQDMTFISILKTAFTSSNLFTLVFPIPSAKVPVIKLVIPITSIIEDSATLSLLHHELSSIDSVSIDIIFTNQFMHTLIPSIEIVKYIKASLCYVPIAKGILFFIKKFLAQKKMNSYYNGGLSSFAIFILLFAVVKVRNCNGGLNGMTAAVLLMHFLEFYGRFNFGAYGANLNMINPFGFLGINAINTPVIMDPVTNLNIGSGTFKIEEIQGEFSKLVIEFRKGYQSGEEGNMITKCLGIEVKKEDKGVIEKESV